MSEHNIAQNASNELTRRLFLKALAILPAAALPTLTFPFDRAQDVPTIQQPQPTPPAASTFNSGLTELIVKLAAFDAYLHTLAGKPAEEVDPEALYERYGQASELTQELDRLLLSVEFEQTILGPLVGGLARYQAALPPLDEIIIPVEQPISRERMVQAFDVLADVVAEHRAKYLAA